MEFPNLGKNCSWSSCNKIDFLPLTCAYCKQIFCKEHFSQDIHECQSFKEAVRCDTVIKSYVCSSEDCTVCNPVEMLCQKCQKHFCLLHRYHDCFDVVEDIETKKLMWSKPKEQFDNSIKNVNDVINEKIKKAIQDPKKQATALKVQLMRLKGKAEGASSIPTTDRIYFLILLPKGSTKLSKPVFVSKEWSVGKVIDEASRITNVINKNNELNSPKLRLFKATDGYQISTDTCIKIGDLISKDEIKNGESLILEYISCGEDLNNFKLNDFSQYKSSF